MVSDEPYYVTHGPKVLRHLTMFGSEFSERSFQYCRNGNIAKEHDRERRFRALQC